jgi:hypothetical protein
LRLGENRRLNKEAHFSQRRKGAKATAEFEAPLAREN